MMRKMLLIGLVIAVVAVPIGYAVAAYAADQLEIAVNRLVADAMLGAFVDVVVTLWR
jgi:hypothetical protein